MIILFHKHNKVVEVFDYQINETIVLNENNPSEVLFILAAKYKRRIIIWCHFDKRKSINLEAVKSYFTSKNIMISYCYASYFGDSLGYVEASPFININKYVKYPTWQMSSSIGAVFSDTLLLFKEHINVNKSFGYNLNSISKLGMSHGLFCYSTPNIISTKEHNLENRKENYFELFEFVKEHYRSRWVFLLFISLLIFENKILLIPFLRSLFFKKKICVKTLQLTKIIDEVKNETSISVLIPTLGRAKYLYDVLKDLEKQTLKPNEVVIIEQDDSEIVKSKLNYIKTEEWPFKIVHKLISQTGACNARNIGLKLVTSDYVFLADDDIRFKENTLHEALLFMQSYHFKAITLSCLREQETEKRKTPIQWTAFGSGCSIVKTQAIKTISFDRAFEHGFGEDTDFGMQLRNIGVDIIYLPYVKLLHLKAPIGGFRKKYIHLWEQQGLAPKPSPTIMYYMQKYQSINQLRRYKLTLFIKFYRMQKIRNPFKYYKTFKLMWYRSIYWSNKLDKIYSK